MNGKTKKLVMSALLAALVCIATMVVKIPSPLKGYLNLGDCIVLTAGWILSPVYGFLAAGIGSALADLFAGYVVYAPVTFAIKGLMAVGAFYIFHYTHKKTGELPARVISGTAAELLMILGYYVFEGILYGFQAAAVNIPANGIQGLAGLMIGIVLITSLEKSRISVE